jgi:predicted glycogen debranching enzyme
MDALLGREWLISNQLGSYASSTVLNCNTRRYHGMLVAANIPPLGRIVTVNNFLERLTIDGREYQLSNFEFNGAIHPKGFEYQTTFQRQIDEDLSCVSFVYEIDGVTFIRTLWLFADHNTALIYWLAVDSKGVRPIRIAAHPLISMRDFH